MNFLKYSKDAMPGKKLQSKDATASIRNDRLLKERLFYRGKKADLGLCIKRKRK